ncbi:MAG: hypothetical protein GKS00_23565 [Alphaproteobacteria bacterium]|nr:hypothetical protein [Alphaproteobacteria bacterium]
MSARFEQSNDCDCWIFAFILTVMRKLRAYLILAGLVAFVGYFGVYEFYVRLVDSIGQGWALAGAVLIALGTVVIAVVGITMIETRVPVTLPRANESQNYRPDE